jgi:hypothetical protein
MRPNNRPVGNIDDENNRGTKILAKYTKYFVENKKYGKEYRALSWIF